MEGDPTARIMPAPLVTFVGEAAFARKMLYLFYPPSPIHFHI